MDHQRGAGGVTFLSIYVCVCMWVVFDDVCFCCFMLTMHTFEYRIYKGGWVVGMRWFCVWCGVVVALLYKPRV